MRYKLPLQTSDVSEDDILKYDRELLEILLKDHTTGTNIIWGTNSYSSFGDAYGFNQEITIDAITGCAGRIIRPRAAKDTNAQKLRSKDNAEVFTPAWMCNAQNNLIDDAWFGEKNVFTTESQKSWSMRRPYRFPTKDGKSWEDYVNDIRLEMTCGEAPYLTSRYDATTSEYIEVGRRVGLLDRKLRVIRQNIPASASLFHQKAIEAYKSTYGFEYQGDNLLLARENLLFTYMDFHYAIKGDRPGPDRLKEIAEIISWNIWQMDGLTYGIPGQKTIEEGLMPIEDTKLRQCIIKDWGADNEITFASMIK